MDALIADFQPEQLKPQMDEVGVHQTVLVQTHSSLENNDEFLSIADVNDWVGAVVGWVDLIDPEVGRTLEALAAHPKFKGVRHQWEDEEDPAWIMRSDVLRGLREVADCGLRYDLLAKPPNWPYLAQVAEAVPDLPLVIDHIAKPSIKTHQFDDWAEAMSRASEVPHMMCKVSGMVTEADWHDWQPSDLKPYVVRAIEIFGADRVMWGSDWPVCVLAGSYAQVFDALKYSIAELDEHVQAKVLGENARRFYDIN
jgi:L-fuconolactonase